MDCANHELDLENISSDSQSSKSTSTPQKTKKLNVLKVKNSDEFIDCKKSPNVKCDTTIDILEEESQIEEKYSKHPEKQIKLNSHHSTNKISQIEVKQDGRTDLQLAQSEGMSILQRLKTAFQVHKTRTFFRPDVMFNKGVNSALHEIENGLTKLGKLLSSSQAPDPVTKSSCSTTATDTSVDITPPASEKGNDAANLDESNCSRQSVQSVMTSDTKVADPASLSRKRKRRHSGWISCIKRPKKIRRSLMQQFAAKDEENNEKKEDDDEESNDGEKEEYEVEKILDYDRVKGKCVYQVRWRGYKSDDDTWEPLTNLTGCEEILLSFIRSRLAERSLITDPEELKTALLPCEESLKPLLRTAFFAQLLAPGKADVEEALPTLITNKIRIKAMGELEEDVDKLVAIKDCTCDRYKKAYADIQQQLVLRECKQQRERQRAELRRWEREMSRICSDPAPLNVVNDVDLSLPPSDFIYVNDYVAGKGISIPQDPVCGCECSDCGMNQNSCCAKQMSSHFAYNKFARLKVSLGTAIYECNKRCACSKSNHCINRVVQKGRTYQLTIFRTDNNRGWGVKAGEPIKTGAFVTEYVGEVISSEEAERRGQIYDARGCTYLFDLDYNKGDQNPYTVDAARYGNVSHFINHSCDPNLVVFNVWINCLDPDMPKLALFAVRDIKKGEELTFDYNTPSSRSQEPTSLNDDCAVDSGSSSAVGTPSRGATGDAEIGTLDLALRKTPKRGHANGKTKCRCGAANCRQYFF